MRDICILIFDKGTANQCCQGRGFPAQLGYFENTVEGKITEPWVAIFLGYFYNVPRPPKVYTCDRKRKLLQTLDGGLK